MQEYQYRVIKEKEELDAKLDALTVFILMSEVYKGLDRIDQNLLLEQQAIMRNYSWVLNQRILRFKQ